MRARKWPASIFGLVLAAGLLCGCAGWRNAFVQDAPGDANATGVFRDQMPVQPQPWLFVQRFDNATGKYADKYWAALSADERRRLLPLHTDHISVFTESANGTVAFSPALITAKGTQYLVLFDFIKGRVERLCDARGAFVTTAMVGVGVRIKARITALEGGVALGSLTALGVSAGAGRTRGELYVQTIGLDSQSISDLMPFTAEVSQSSVQTILQSLAAIKSKMWDGATTVTPHLISYAPVEGLEEGELRYCRAEASSGATADKRFGGGSAAIGAQGLPENAARLGPLLRIR